MSPNHALTKNVEFIVHTELTVLHLCIPKLIPPLF